MAIGHPRAWRRVGTILSYNRDRATPCHRVVRADGRMGGFGFPGGVVEKLRRLRREGVAIVGDRVDLRVSRITSLVLLRRTA